MMESLSLSLAELPAHTHSPWKTVVGRLLSYWEGNFSGAMLNFGRVNIIFVNQIDGSHEYPPLAVIFQASLREVMGAGAVTAKNPAVQRDILAKKKKKGTTAKQIAPVVPKPHADGGDVDGNPDQSTLRSEDEVLHGAIPKNSTQSTHLNSVEEEWGLQGISTYFKAEADALLLAPSANACIS